MAVVKTTVMRCSKSAEPDVSAFRPELGGSNHSWLVLGTQPNWIPRLELLDEIFLKDQTSDNEKDFWNAFDSAKNQKGQRRKRQMAGRPIIIWIGLGKVRFG